MRDEHLFGVRLHPVAARTDLDSGAREIGVVHDGELLVMEHEDGSIWVRDVATGDTSPLNRDRAATEGFLEAFADYLSSGQPVPGPTTMTAEQAAERLRAFRAGEVRPPSRPSGHRAPSHRARLRTLRARLRAVDSAATRPGSWWSGPLEEAENDLL